MGMLQLRRGIESSLPALADGEPGWCTDTFQLFIGQSGANHQIGGGIVDGDKGDITVASGVWTIDNGVVTEAKQLLADNTTWDVSAAQHGYAPKAPGDPRYFLAGDGTWKIPDNGGIFFS